MTEKYAICVFCGSSDGNNPHFTAAAAALGRGLADGGFRLVYGGGGRGMMGALARAMLAGGGEITAIMPDFLRGHELPPENAFELTLTIDLQQRKSQLMDAADAFVVLPGGPGTMDEFFEVVTSANLGRLNKPILVVDIDGYFAPLFRLMDHMVKQGLTHSEYGKVYAVVPSVEAALTVLSQTLYRPR